MLGGEGGRGREGSGCVNRRLKGRLGSFDGQGALMNDEDGGQSGWRMEDGEWRL